MGYIPLNQFTDEMAEVVKLCYAASNECEKQTGDKPVRFILSKDAFACFPGAAKCCEISPLLILGIICQVNNLPGISVAATPTPSYQ